jgi:hypothetical protein
MHQAGPGQCYAFPVRVPVWLTLGVAILVATFGAYRIRLSFKKPEDTPGKVRVFGGGTNPKMHLFIGIVYVLLGAALAAMSFGWTPMGNSVGPDTEAPPKDKAPTTGGIPIDTLPTKK